MADTATKTVSFKFVVDQQAVAQVKGVLQELTQQATKFAEAMKSAGGFFGGGNVGAGAGGKSTAQTMAGATAGGGGAGPVGAAAAGVKDVADKSVSALQKLTAELRKNVGEQKRDLGELGKALDSVMQRFVGISNFSGRMGKFLGPSYQGPGGGGGGPIGGMSRAGDFLSTEIGSAGGGISGLIGLLAKGGGAIGVAKLAQQGYLGYKASEREGMLTAAQYGQTFLKPYEAARQGDITQMVAAGSMTPGERAAMGAQVSSAEYLIKNPFSATGKAIAGAFMGDDRFAQGREQFRESNRQAMVDAKTKQFGFQSEFSDPKEYFESTIDARLHASRILGLTTGTDRMEGGRYIKGYDSFKAKLWETGYDDPQYLAAHVGMRTMVGRAGASSAWAAMGANAAGFSGYENLLASSVRAGNRGANFAMGGPLARDPQMAIQLGQVALGQGFDPMGTTGGLGMLAATQGAVALGQGQGISAPNLIARAQEGIKAGEGIFSDSSPLQSGRNLLAAIQANPTGGVYAQTAMSQLSYRQVQDIVHGGPIPSNLRNQGVTKSMIEEYFKTTASSSLLDYVSTGNSPVDLAVNRFRASGQDVSTYLQQNQGERGLLETAMQAAHPEMFTTEGAVGFGDQLAGGGRGLRAGRGPAGPMDKTIAARRKQQADKDLDQGTRLNDLQKQLQEGYAASRGLAGALNSTISSAQNSSDALDKFGAAVVGATDAIRSWFGGKGGSGGKKAAPKVPEKGK